VQRRVELADGLGIRHAERFGGPVREQTVAARREVHLVVRPVAQFTDVVGRVELQEDRTVRGRDAAQLVTEPGEPPRERRRRATARQERRQEQHVRSLRPQARDGVADLRAEASHVGARRDEVVGADEDRDQVGAHLECPGDLLVAHVLHAPAAHREVRVPQRLRRPLREQRREAVRPAAVLALGHARGVAQPLRDRVAERDDAAPRPRCGRGGHGRIHGRGCRGRNACDAARPRRRHTGSLQRDRLVVVLPQASHERGPRALADALARGEAERTALALVTGEVLHACAQVAQVARRVQPAIDARPHEVDGAAGAGRDDGHAARVRLLQRLAERLALPRVHEDVEARDGLRQFSAGEVAEEHGIRQVPLHSRARGSVADDHDLDAGDVTQRAQILDLLLGGQTPDVADDDLAGCDPPAPRVAAALGREPLGVDAPAPHAYAVDAEGV